MAHGALNNHSYEWYLYYTHIFVWVKDFFKKTVSQACFFPIIGAMKYIKCVWLIVFCLWTLTGCGQRFKYRPMAPKNLRMTSEEKEALKQIEVVATKEELSESKEKVMAAYFKVSKYDGISEEEARTLAQSELFFRGKEKEYVVAQPELVSLTENGYQFKFPAIMQPLATETLPALLVEVDPSSGNVFLSRQYRVDPQKIGK